MFRDTIRTITPLNPSFFSVHSACAPDYSFDYLNYVITKSRNLQLPAYEDYGSYACTESAVIAAIRKAFSSDENSVKLLLFSYAPYTPDSELDKLLKEHDVTELVPHEKFIESKTNVGAKIYIKPEINLAIVMTGQQIFRGCYHLIVSLYPSLFPNIFKDVPIHPDEVSALKGLTYLTSDHFVEAMQILLKPFKSEILQAELMGCFEAFRNGRINEAYNTMENIRSSMEQLMENYRRQAEQLEDAVIRYEGLKAIKDDTDNSVKEFVEYLSSVDNIHSIEYDRNTLKFKVLTLLTNFDVEKYRLAVSRNDLYDSYNIMQDNVFSKKENRKLLLDALFGTETPSLAVNIYGKINLNLGRCYMSVENGSESDMEIKNYLQNPHYARHACPGQNRDMITECLSRQDLITAIECCIAATGGVNIGETDITFRPFLQELFTSENKVIHNLETNKDMTPQEALFWIAERKHNEANSND